MSDSLEDAMVECQPQSSRSSASSASAGPQPAAVKPADDIPTAPAEKTISCVSCRKRKLKCDRVKPKCGTCTRLRHECDYPERKRNMVARRRNMKELEARLAQVETQLVAETTKGATTSQTSADRTTTPDWNNFAIDMDMENVGALDDSFNMFSAFDYQPAATPAAEENLFSQGLLSLGLEEPLPPNEMIEELHKLYFDKLHTTMPLMHKYRYLASLNLPAHMQPPICLRYAIWASATSLSDKYMQYDTLLYERARKYVERAEMKGQGETFTTVQYAQTWALIAAYEAKKTLFTRAWMSTGRTTRLVQMLGLQRLDAKGHDVKRLLPTPKDWIELEERRRTFWAAFYGDRWASAGTGWPMVIDEKEILTDLPASEESFETGVEMETVSLSAALTPEGASKISPFGGVILSACLFGHNFEHIHKLGPDERPEDLANGEFWKRHRLMDNVLSNTFMFLPDHLRLPAGVRDMNVIFVHMNIHASTICLHQAAVLTAEKNNVSKTFIRQSRARSLMAAEEITNIMKLVSHLDASNMNSWMGFCLYVAGGVFIQDLRSNDHHPQSMQHLDFLLAALKAIGNRHAITKHFTAQLELDIGISEIKPSLRPIGKAKIPNTGINGIDPLRMGAPAVVAELHSLQEPASYVGIRGLDPFKDSCPFLTNLTKGDANFHTTTAIGILPQQSPKGGLTNTHPAGSIDEKHVRQNHPNWNPSVNITLDQSTQNQQQTLVGNRGFAMSPTPPVSVNPNPRSGGSPFDIDSFLAANTPSSDSSSSNTMQFPYRQPDSGSHNNSTDYAMFQADPNSFVTASNWSTEAPFNTEQQGGSYEFSNGLQPSDVTRQLMDTASWGQNLTPPHG